MFPFKELKESTDIVVFIGYITKVRHTLNILLFYTLFMIFS